MTELFGMSNKTVKSDCENYGKKKTFILPLILILILLENYGKYLEYPSANVRIKYPRFSEEKKKKLNYISFF